jgi:hypothetical protein
LAGVNLGREIQVDEEEVVAGGHIIVGIGTARGFSKCIVTGGLSEDFKFCPLSVDKVIDALAFIKPFLEIFCGVHFLQPAAKGKFLRHSQFDVVVELLFREVGVHIMEQGVLGLNLDDEIPGTLCCPGSW